MSIIVAARCGYSVLLVRAATFRFAQPTRLGQVLRLHFEGSWVGISRVISTLNKVIKAAISIDSPLITPLVTTHEPARV